MPYKTILVHLTSEQRAGPLLRTAAAIGDRFQSHIVALHVFPAFRLVPPVSMPFGKELAGTLRRQIREEADRVRSAAEFELKSILPKAITLEWRSILSERRPAADIVIEHARAADLLVVSQSDPNWDFSDILDCPDRLTTGSGRPIMVLPITTQAAEVPRTVAVAWNGRREAARAVFDALPLLQLADRVEIITIDEGVHHAEGRLPDVEIAAAIGRHGVKARLMPVKPQKSSIAQDILCKAQETGASMLVMGGYGHSRMSEFVLGGVTRDMLRHMTIPVLFSN